MPISWGQTVSPTTLTYKHESKSKTKDSPETKDTKDESNIANPGKEVADGLKHQTQHQKLVQLGYYSARESQRNKSMMCVVLRSIDCKSFVGLTEGVGHQKVVQVLPLTI